MKKQSLLYLIAGVMIATVYMVYFGVQVAHRNMYLPLDSYEYVAEAYNIRTSCQFYCGDLTKGIDNDLYTKRPPLYPLFILAVKSISSNDLAIIFAQTLVAMFNVFLTYRLLLRLKPDMPAWMSVALGVMLVFTPSQFIYANFIMAEIVLQTALLCATYALVDFLLMAKLRSMSLYTGFVIVALLVKPALYLFVLPNIAVTIAVCLAKKKISFACLSLIPLLFVYSYMLWNENRTGACEYSSIQNCNLISYNGYYYLMHTQGEEVARARTEAVMAEAGKKPTYRERQAYIAAEGKAILLENPIRYALFHARGALTIFFDPGRFEIYKFFNILTADGQGLLYLINKNGVSGVLNFLRAQSFWIILLLLFVMALNVVKIIAMISFVFERSVPLFVRGAIFMFPLYIAATTGPCGAARFAVPVLPMIFICLAFFLLRISSFAKAYCEKIKRTRIMGRMANEPL